MFRARRWLAFLAIWIPAAAFADGVTQTQQAAGSAGASGIWMLANERAYGVELPKKR